MDRFVIEGMVEFNEVLAGLNERAATLREHRDAAIQDEPSYDRGFALGCVEDAIKVNDRVRLRLARQFAEPEFIDHPADMRWDA